MRRPSLGRIALAALVVAAIAAALLSGVGELLTLDNLKARRGELADMIEHRPLPHMAA
jgi:hypothetical protein